MNARVKPAPFMPLFATTTTEGPSSPEQLIEQMRAGGMMAGAWVVEGMLERLNAYDEVSGGMTLDDMGYIKGEAKELSVDIKDLVYSARCLAERLKEALSPDELEAEAEKAETLMEALDLLSDKADHVYDSFDC